MRTLRISSSNNDLRRNVIDRIPSGKIAEIRCDEYA